MAKPLNEQVVVITGASSGIGRAAALRFGKAGAKVVLAARNVVGLQTAADEIRAAGGEALVVPTDVGEWEQVQRLAEHAVTAYGRIDTWVNDAAVGVYATADDTTVDEVSQVMQTNFMGVVHGVKAVLPIMKAQQYGTIINMGSGESYRTLPLNAAYAASKHAIKAYTDALRMELDYEQSGIAVTLIMPAGINTPFFQHAVSRLGVLPRPAPPVYAPELVAEAIAAAAAQPQRDIYVGGASLLFSLMERISPKLTDKLMTAGGVLFRAQKSEQPDDGQDTLFSTIPEPGQVTGSYAHLVKPSLYTRLFELSPKPVRTFLPVVLIGSLLAIVLNRR